MAPGPMCLCGRTSERSTHWPGCARQSRRGSRAAARWLVRPGESAPQLQRTEVADADGWAYALGFDGPWFPNHRFGATCRRGWLCERHRRDDDLAERAAAARRADARTQAPDRKRSRTKSVPAMRCSSGGRAGAAGVHAARRAGEGELAGRDVAHSASRPPSTPWTPSRATPPPLLVAVEQPGPPDAARRASQPRGPGAHAACRGRCTRRLVAGHVTTHAHRHRGHVAADVPRSRARWASTGCRRRDSWRWKGQSR